MKTTGWPDPMKYAIRLSHKSAFGRKRHLTFPKHFVFHKMFLYLIYET